MDCKGINILITGVQGSLGHVLALEFHKQGSVVLGIDLSPVQDRFPKAATYFQCDLLDWAAISITIDKIFDLFGGVDVLINNAGLIYSSPLINLLDREKEIHGEEEWRKTLDSNLNTAFNVTSKVAYRMIKERRKGVIINISSVAAKGNIGQSAYSAAKAGIESLTVTWSKELSMFGIRTNSISPGFFDTHSTRTSLDENTLKKWAKNIPLGRLGNPLELSHAAKFIIENEYYNGQVLHLNGGLRI